MTRKPTIYLETTIPSFLSSRSSNNLVVAGKQEVTRQWWESRRGSFELFTSQYVLDEISRGDAEQVTRRNDFVGDLALLEVDEAVVELAKIIMVTGLIPFKAHTDAAHIAVATRHGMDFLMTWNCRHIANAQILAGLSSAVAQAGFVLPTICTPDELFGGDEN